MKLLNGDLLFQGLSAKRSRFFMRERVNINQLVQVTYASNRDGVEQI